MEPIMVIGCGGHALACIDVLEQEGKHRIAGLVGRRAEVGQRVLGYPVVGADDDLPSLLASTCSALVAVGQIKTPVLRMRLFEAVVAAGKPSPPIVSPRAYVSRHAVLGEGTIVLHGAVVNAGASIGRNCIINSLALIEHEAEVGDHCHVATGAVLNGGVRVGSGSFIGSGAVVKQEVRVGLNCVVGMGQRVLGECADGEWLPPAKER